MCVRIELERMETERKGRMIDLAKELKSVLEKKEISPEIAAKFIGVSGRDVRG